MNTGLREMLENIFLDIQMPGKTGFDLLAELDRAPQVIFTTAHHEFALKASEILFAPTTLETLQSLSEAQLLDVLEGVPQVQGVMAELEQGLDLITFMADQKIVNSKGDARKLIQNGGVAINKQKVGVEQTQINTSDLLNQKYLLIQKGKSNYYLAVFN